MKASDAFIRPSRTEGLGNAFLEAMAAGIPVIGTEAGGIKDFLTDGVTGFVVHINDPQSIVGAVNRVIELSEGERADLVARSKRLVMEKHDWDTIGIQMQEFFNEVTT
jgi:glycosyltransferase involved in cell wall biosynthesis